ncbi:hypothetical protein TSUD_375770, partial [Trifolium subterraneum]
TKGVEEESVLTPTQQKQLGDMLLRYDQVFQEPTGLPPRRNKDHAINLVENYGAVNIRSYRYPYHHKNEIEKQVKELLAAGVIRHSTSPITRAIEETPLMSIKLGDGSRAQSQGVVKGLEMAIGKFKLTPEMHLFELGGIDVVLGMDWLKTLGDMIVNWRQQTMSFWSNKKWVTLQGIDGGDRELVALQCILSKPRWGMQNELWGIETKGVEEESILTPTQQKQLGDMLLRYDQVFQEPTGLPPRRNKEHAINLVENYGAVNIRPYRYPYHHKNEIEKQVKELLAAGVIRHSTSPFSSPVILVKKKDNTWRMCIDYRALNKVTIPDKFPIPVIEELLDELHGANFYSKLDLKSGYHQFRVKEDDIGKTAFRTHEGHYEFLVMPFGLMNAPSTFQSLMNDVFSELLKRGVLVFFDDILVYSKGWEAHMNRGVAVDPNKVKSVMQWPTPMNVKGVKGFLGLTGYYRKFIRDYGKIAKPLTDLTKKDSFKWGVEAQGAFDELKRKLTSAPVLALPDFSKNFVIECDASGSGIGAILMQDKKPIAYFSKALGVRNLTKSAYEKELMAVVLAIQHWRPYLLGRKFIVSTDQKSLKQLMQQRIVIVEQQNWAAKLLGYDFEIIYKQGKLNRGADALSRVNEGGELSQINSFAQWDQSQQIKTENNMDEKLQDIIRQLQQDPKAKPGYEYRQGVLLYEGRLVLSNKSQLIPTLLKEFHASPQGGHSGFYKTYRRVAANVYWLGMKGTVQDFVKSCDVCQRQKYLASSPGGLLQPLPVPQQIWEDIFMDFITGLPKSKGFEAIWEVVKLHGVPSTIVSDRDPIFMSCFWQEIFKLQGTHLKMSSAYHPESDGQTEVVNRCLETYLRCFIADQPNSWVGWVHWAEYWFNINYHTSTAKTPFEIVYGRLPPQLKRWSQGETRVEAVQRELIDRDEALRQLKHQLMKAQERMKSQADRKREDRSFMVGEWVVKLRAHRYKLKLPSGSKVHPVFHVSLLKKAVGNYSEEEELPELLVEDQMENYEPMFVVASRKIRQNGEEVRQVLIQWKGQTVEEATWEDVVMMKSQFPGFNLEDKIIAEGGGVDRTHINTAMPHEQLIYNQSNNPKTWLVYSRRGKKGIND